MSKLAHVLWLYMSMYLSVSQFFFSCFFSWVVFALTKLTSNVLFFRWLFIISQSFLQHCILEERQSHSGITNIQCISIHPPHKLITAHFIEIYNYHTILHAPFLSQTSPRPRSPRTSSAPGWRRPSLARSLKRQHTNNFKGKIHFPHPRAGLYTQSVT